MVCVCGVCVCEGVSGICGGSWCVWGVCEGASEWCVVVCVGCVRVCVLCVGSVVCL